MSQSKTKKYTCFAAFLIFLFFVISNQIYAATPTIGSIAPTSGSSETNKEIIFTTIYSDASGYADINSAYLLINTSVNGTDCFYGYYDPAANKLYLRDNANANWLGGFAPGSSNIIENSYCKLNCLKVTKTGSGTSLTIKWAITFKDTFAGVKNTYLYVKDKTGLYAGWTQKGNYCLLVKPISPP